MSNVAQEVGVLRRGEGILAAQEILGDDGVTQGVECIARVRGIRGEGIVPCHTRGADRRVDTRVREITLCTDRGRRNGMAQGLSHPEEREKGGPSWRGDRPDAVDRTQGRVGRIAPQEESDNRVMRK